MSSLSNMGKETLHDKCQESLNRQEVKRIVRRLEALPSLPSVATKILNMFIGDDTDIKEVVRMIETDQALTIKLLKLVNSAYFGLRKSISSIPRAVALLGLDQLRLALLSVTISENLIKPLQRGNHSDQETLSKHSLACAVWSEMLAEKINPSLKTEAFVGGLLHDVGKLVLEECFPEKYDQVRKLNLEGDVLWIEAEQNILKTDHTIVGKWLAEKWNLPRNLTEAIWLHHHSLNAIAQFDFLKDKVLAVIICLSDVLAHESLVDSMLPYQVSMDLEDVLAFLKITSNDIDKLKASVGKRYSERSAVFDMTTEDEISFYYGALQRANQKLAKIASKGRTYGTLEKAKENLAVLHRLHLDLAQTDDVDEILETVSEVLINDFKINKGVIYYINKPEKKLMGKFWVSLKRAENFQFDLDKDNNPVFVDNTGLDEEASRLIRTCHIRFMNISDREGNFMPLQYYKPFLILPMIVHSCLVGEILLGAKERLHSETMKSMDLELYRYLTLTIATALNRVELINRVEETAENINKALLTNDQLFRELNQSKRQFENLFEYSNDAIILHNIKGKILEVNQRTNELLGYPEEEIKRKSFKDIFAARDSQEVKEMLEVQCQGQEGCKIESRLICKDGKIIDVEISSRIVDQTAGCIQSIVRDITNEKEAARELLMQKEKLDITLRSIGDGVISSDSMGRVILINRVAEELTGYRENEAIGMPLERIFRVVHGKQKKEYTAKIQEVLETGDMATLPDESVLITRDNKKKFISGSVAPIFDNAKVAIGVIIVFRDITVRKKMEEELLRSQKLESVGTLAGGIAHDFNNILTVILGNIALAKMYTEPDNAVFKMLTEAEKGSTQAKNLTQQLLTFSRGGAPVKKVTSIAGLIRQSVDFSLRGSNVSCEFSVKDNLWAVEVDDGQISQVINNLVINAIQAMPDGGVINVTAENVTLDKSSDLPLSDGKYIKISVGDQGIGISPDNISKIFNPYFTTKRGGHGLGLATCYSIIRNHGGYICVQSKEGIGTTFYLYLAASEEEAQYDDKKDEKPVQGSGRILIMDDDENVKNVLSMMLKELGYEVELTSNGEQTINVYETNRKLGKPFDLVIMDLTIKGGMGGKETIKKLTEIEPGVKALVSSGYNNDPILAEYEKYGFMGIITKPYTVEKLSSAVDMVLRGKS